MATPPWQKRKRPGTDDGPSDSSLIPEPLAVGAGSNEGSAEPLPPATDVPEPAYESTAEPEPAPAPEPAPVAAAPSAEPAPAAAPESQNDAASPADEWDRPANYGPRTVIASPTPAHPQQVVRERQSPLTVGVAVAALLLALVTMFITRTSSDSGTSPSFPAIARTVTGCLDVTDDVLSAYERGGTPSRDVLAARSELCAEASSVANAIG